MVKAWWALNRWFTLPIAEMAWLVSLLNTLFSFARSSRIQILFEPILIRSISFVSVLVRVFLPVRWASASASEVASTSFLDARSTSMACFVSSRTLVRLSQVARCSQAAAAAVVAAAVFASCSSTWPWVLIKTTGSSSVSCPNGFRAVQKTDCRALSFSCLPGISPLPKMDWKFHEILLW